MRKAFESTQAALVCAAILAFAFVPAQASATDDPPQTVIDAGTDHTLRMTVPVTIDGRGPYPFIVDTGSDRTVISRELAATLKLADGGPATMHSMGGIGEVRTVHLTSLDIGGGRTVDIKAPALAQNDLGAQGLLGIDSLKARRIEMDFRDGTFAIADAKTRERIDRDTIVVTAQSRYGQLILVDSDIDGTPITVIIDSGSQNSIGNLALRHMLARRNKVGAFSRIALTDVSGRVIAADLAAVSAIRIGGFSINNVAVAFVDAHPFKRFGLLKRPAMLLGMDTLRAFRRVSIDFADRRVRFLLPETVSQTSPEQWFAFRSPDIRSPL